MEQLSVTAKNRRSLWIVFGLTAAYFGVEVVGGLLTNSLALLADAAHMLTDVGGLALALFAAWMSAKPATPAKTYGYYRAEILAALANAVALFLMSFYILYEAVQRFAAPPAVASVPMLAVAAVGLVVNLIGIALLHGASGESLNLRGAYLEVVGDLLGSVGVIAAAAVMWATGWYYADPIFGVAIGLFILPRTWKLMRQATDVLLEATPAHINISEVESALLGIEGVTSVHDLHVWSITSGIDALSAHLVLRDGSPLSVAASVIEQAGVALKERFNIVHSTLQLESVSRKDQEPNF